jgi:hypothetical protein
MNGKKLTNLVSSGLLATTLIFSAGAGAVFAEGDGSAAEQTETVVDETTTDTSAEATTEETNTEEVSVDAGEVTDETATDEDQAAQDDATTEEDQTTQDETATEEEQSSQEETPSLVPGDFFYFVKIMAEKIRLAVTFDDYKEAKLLADYAAERIAESKALLADGKTDEAAELLKEAVATQEQASEQLTDSEAVTEDEATDTDGTAEVKLLNNVNGLLNALGNVKNETAQLAIMNNLQKSFKKLDKKLTKLEEKDAKFAERKKQIEEKVDGQVSDDEAIVEKNKKGKALGKGKVKKAETVEVEESTTTPEQATTVVNEEAVTSTEATQTQVPVEQKSVSEKGAEKQAQAAAKASENQAKAGQKKVQAQEKHNKPVNNGQGNKGEKGNGKGNN